MQNKYAKLFERVQINGMYLKNRFAMSPMGTFTENIDGTLPDKTLNYFEERAKGGAALIISEVQYVTNKLDPWLAHQRILDTEEQMKAWYKMAELVHAHNAKLCVQLGCGLGKNAFIFTGDGGDMVSASENPSFYKPEKICRPMTKEEIQETVKSYARAAKRCITAEVDAVEIHAHAGYMFDQFMTPVWNRRTDEYGGSFENRMRFLVEVYQAIRNETGKNYPILIRLAAHHDYKEGRTLEDTIKIVKYLEEVGIDAFDIDLGCYEEKKWIVPTPYAGFSCMADAAGKIKKAVKVPVLNSGTHTPETALKAVEEEKIDIVMMGRPLIADPELPNKLFRGHREDIRPCLFCNECGGQIYKGLYLRCAVNARAAAEEDFPLTKTDEPKTVVVVGGGPGGMEAANIAATRGHKVRLYEKSSALGGQLIPAAGPAFKSHLKDMVSYYEAQLKKSGVEVYLNSEITDLSPELENADYIIVALGASPFVPPIKGIDLANVVEVTRAHRQPSLIRGKKILIAGGGLSGCDAAIELAREGKDVTIVEMKDTIAPEVWNIDNRNPLLFELRDRNVKILTGYTIQEFNNKGAVAKGPDGELTLDADTIITAFGMRPANSIANRICDKYTTAVVPVGDCIKVGQVGAAVRGGFFAGWFIP
jgi:2,4-dienoyl-CoA reductase-like NADH-dependent reductase (Old Yellow Enzyme family)/NADPH-dependent 2,4-dienoyl-CoA reductase/sulfur reductase-like enzyme